MKRIHKITLVALLAVVMIACHKEKDVTVNAHFYLSDAVSSGPLTLYIMGEAKGLLPRPNVPITCGMAGIDTLTLSFPLKSGTYDLTIKDAAGNLVHESSCTVKENSTAGSCKKGGQGISKSGECFVVDLQTESSSGS